MGYLFCLFPLYLILLLVRKNKPYVTIVYWIMALFLLIGACLRPPEIGKGHDIFNYYDGYCEISYKSTDSILNLSNGYHRWEPGYLILNKMLSTAFGSINIECFLTIFVFIILLPIVYYLWEKSTYPFFSMALFISAGGIMSALTGFRQQCAAVVLLGSFHYIERNEFIKSFLLIMIASLFHRSALIVFVFGGLYYFLKTYTINKKFLIVSLLLAIVLHANLEMIYSYFVSYLRIEYELKEADNYGHLFVLWGTLIFSFIFDRKINDNRTTKFYYLMLLFSAILQFMVMGGSQLSRINKYFIFPLCFVLPSAIESFMHILNKRKVVFPMIILNFLLFFMFVITFLASYGNYYEFEFKLY